MELSHLKEFVYLANSLSFKRTAEHFYVSRSVISRHIAGLEESLGVRLVDRGGQGVQLTEVGEEFYRDVLVLLRAYATALEHVRESQVSHTPIVRIGYLRNAARPVIVRFVRYMTEHYPDIHLSMTCMEYGELRRAMEDGAVDVALAVNVSPEVSRNYRSTRIYTDRFSLVMSADLPQAGQVEGVDLADIPEDKLLVPDSFAYAGLSEIVDGLIEGKTQLLARAYYSDLDMLYLKVQTEGFVAFSSGLNNVIFGDQIAVLPIRDVDTSFTVSAFYRHELEEDLFHACRMAFEHCRDAMKNWKSEKSQGCIGYTIASTR